MRIIYLSSFFRSDLPSASGARGPFLISGLVIGTLLIGRFNLHK